MLGASLARRRQAAARPAASRRAAQRQRELRDDRLPRWKMYPLEHAGMLLEGAASLRLAPCHTAAPRPARSSLSHGTVASSCGGRVAESAPLAAPERAEHQRCGAPRRVQCDLRDLRDLGAPESPPRATCLLRVGRRRDPGVSTPAALVAPNPVLVQRAHPRERGRQLRVLQPCHRCRWRDSHPGDTVSHRSVVVCRCAKPRVRRESGERFYNCVTRRGMRSERQTHSRSLSESSPSGSPRSARARSRSTSREDRRRRGGNPEDSDPAGPGPSRGDVPGRRSASADVGRRPGAATPPAAPAARVYDPICISSS